MWNECSLVVCLPSDTVKVNLASEPSANIITLDTVNLEIDQFTLVMKDDGISIDKLLSEKL